MHTYFSVCVTNGANESMVVTFVNKEIMKTHLLPISKATVSNSHVVVIMDGAGWHVGMLIILMHAWITFQ